MATASLRSPRVVRFSPPDDEGGWREREDELLPYPSLLLLVPSFPLDYPTLVVPPNLLPPSTLDVLLLLDTLASLILLKHALLEHLPPEEDLELEEAVWEGISRAEAEMESERWRRRRERERGREEERRREGRRG